MRRHVSAFLGLLLAAPAFAQAPLVAVVEDISIEMPDVDTMSMLSEGREIRLPPGARLIVGYFRTCTREIITGGVIRIGATESTVTGGQVARERVECDGGNLRLRPSQITAVLPGDTGRARASRPDDDPDEPRGRGAPRPPAPAAAPPPGPMPPPNPPAPTAVELTIYGLSPAIDVGAPLLISIQRLDGAGWMTLALSATDLRNGVYDMARAGIVLERGGVYRVSSGGRQIVIRVAPNAAPGAIPVLQRLIRF